MAWRLVVVAVDLDSSSACSSGVAVEVVRTDVVVVVGGVVEQGGSGNALVRFLLLLLLLLVVSWRMGGIHSIGILNLPVVVVEGIVRVAFHGDFHHHGRVRRPFHLEVHNLRLGVVQAVVSDIGRTTQLFGWVVAYGSFVVIRT